MIVDMILWSYMILEHDMTWCHAVTWYLKWMHLSYIQVTCYFNIYFDMISCNLPQGLLIPHKCPNYVSDMYNTGTIGNGINTYFWSFLINGWTDLLVNLHNNSPHYYLYSPSGTLPTAKFTGIFTIQVAIVLILCPGVRHNIFQHGHHHWSHIGVLTLNISAIMLNFNKIKICPIVTILESLNLSWQVITCNSYWEILLPKSQVGGQPFCFCLDS